MSDLIDREAVREFIKSYRNSTDVAFHMEDHLDEIPAASPWHRVEEELPKDRETVLIYCDNTGGIVKSHYHEFIGSGGKKHYWFSGGTHYPKYWMPMPEPPKEDA